MIGVDTNILLRYVVDDGHVLRPAAISFMDVRLSPVDRAFVSLIVVSEFVWALRKVYRRPKPDIIAAVRALLDHAHLLVEDQEAVESALLAYSRGRAGFTDYLIGAVARHRGCSTTYTFDKEAAVARAFTLLT